MSEVLRWICGCGAEGRGEQAAQRHAKDCPRMGWPWCNPDYPRPEEKA